MFNRTSTRSLIGLMAVFASIALSASAVFAAGGPGLDPAGAPSSGGGGGGGVPAAGGGGGGGGSTPVQCGKLSAVSTYFINVYTYRQGIGVGGTATNCSTGGGGSVPYTVVVTDTDPNPACTVNVPHYTSIHTVSAGSSISWAAASTLVPCQGQNHVFDVKLLAGATVLDATTASLFL